MTKCTCFQADDFEGLFKKLNEFLEGRLEITVVGFDMLIRTELTSNYRAILIYEDERRKA